MNCIHCPICNFTIHMEETLTKAKINEHNVCVRMKEHINNHRVVEVLNYLDDIWAEEYNKIYETLKE